jgi:hypothetical protein
MTRGKNETGNGEQEAARTTRVRIRGTTYAVTEKRQQFPPLYILTPDDGHIGRNML